MDHYIGLKVELKSGKEITFIGKSPISPEEFEKKKKTGQTLDQILDLTTMKLIPPRAYDEDMVDEIRQASMHTEEEAEASTPDPTDDIDSLN